MPRVYCSFTHQAMGVESGGRGGGGGGDASHVTNLGGDVPCRFQNESRGDVQSPDGENEVAQIRCLFGFLVHFGGRLATCRRFVSPIKNPWRRPCCLHRASTSAAGTTTAHWEPPTLCKRSSRGSQLSWVAARHRWPLISGHPGTGPSGGGG